MDKKRILLVEDNQVLLKLYTDILTGEQFAIDTADEGESAFTKIANENWDLILLDVILPKQTGIDIVKKLKAELPQKDLKNIVFLTNLDKGEEIDSIKKLGFTYLIKSNLNPAELIEKVKSRLHS